ncbi:hypothetical protein, partial [Enterobacter cloacae complex sp. CH23B]|uniref:hypothetical protein n=1 Tax=Enterobacter cloacae complex sp. CH23B TaxID=2511986 RepID=UPI001CA5E247
HKGNSNKAKEKRVYKGKNKLSPEELDRYRKDNRCFKCGEQGHAYRACPQKNNVKILLEPPWLKSKRRRLIKLTTKDLLYAMLGER